MITLPNGFYDKFNEISTHIIYFNPSLELIEVA